MKSLKEQLRNLYAKNWKSFSRSMRQQPDMRFKNHPHLLSTTPQFEEEWNDADLRIMIFGISTNGWGSKERFDVYHEDSDNALDNLMSLCKLP